MPEYDVTVNDPDMKLAHRYRIQAADDWAARRAGARKAAIDDKTGVVLVDDEAVARVIAAEFTKAIPVDELVVHDA